MRQQIIDEMFKIAKTSNAFEMLEEQFGNITKSDLSNQIADVYAKTNDYTLVGDAKCFRLSRTAKNQKDFKVSALDDWRRTGTYAVLVSPLFQYPVDRSQIYAQAISRNVTLLSLTHLKLLLDKSNGIILKDLWEVGLRLSRTYTTAEQQRGNVYWYE